MTFLHVWRPDHDFYPTPPEATRALLSVERFEGPIWEPACGDGAIAQVLIGRGHTVISTDLIDRGWGTGGVNFLDETANRGVHIITNPPYGRGLGDIFIRHALKLTRPTGGSVAMLVPLDSLAHPTRTPLWLAHPPAAIYAMDELICQPRGIPTIQTAKLRFCWIVWHPGHVTRPTFWWLHARNFRDGGR